MAAMRRTLAIALAAGLLLVGGCARARQHQPVQPAPAPAAATTADEVDGLLGQAGQQLAGDAQTPQDED
jgi:hypothetical protein